MEDSPANRAQIRARTAPIHPTDQLIRWARSYQRALGDDYEARDFVRYGAARKTGGTPTGSADLCGSSRPTVRLWRGCQGRREALGGARAGEEMVEGGSEAGLGTVAAQCRSRLPPP